MRHRGRLTIPMSRALLSWPVVSRLTDRAVHLAAPPALSDLYERCGAHTVSPEDAMEALLGVRAGYADGYAGVPERFREAAEARGRRYAEEWAVEDGTARLLYILTRQARPATVVEVGVADGRSTHAILSALDDNGAGRLVSVDIRDDVGRAVAGHPRWELRIRSAGKSSGSELRAVLGEVGPPDLFFHDASHTYYDQYTDYVAAYDHTRPGALIVSDDVDTSWAFMDFTRGAEVKPVIQMDVRKATGAFVRPAG